jgi:hypothetical protein
LDEKIKGGKCHKKEKKKGALKWDPAMHEWNCGRLGGFNQYYFAHP